HLVARLVCHHFYSRRPGLLQDLLERLRRVRNNRDCVGLLPNQFPNNVDLLLRISIVSADHGGVNPILRSKLPDPFLHALKPRDPGSFDCRDDPDFLPLRLVWAALAAWSTNRKRNGKQECQAGNDYALRISHHILTFYFSDSFRVLRFKTGIFVALHSPNEKSERLRRTLDFSGSDRFHSGAGAGLHGVG